MNPENRGGEAGNDRPFLFIPGYPPPDLPAHPMDTGDRPMPSGVCWYLSAGIEPLTPYQPGTDLTVRVTVGNWQGGNSDSIAYVSVWWSPPVSGPTIPDPACFIGFTTVKISPHGGHVVSEPLTVGIPADAGDHICVLASVTHPLDPPVGTIADPGQRPPLGPAQPRLRPCRQPHTGDLPGHQPPA